MPEDPGKVVHSLLSGTVCDILVSPGSVISVGDEVIVVEAMKMEIPVEATAAGTVAEVLVTIGQRIAEGDRLLVLQ